MRTCRDFTNVRAIKAVYFAYVRSHLEYCSQVWNVTTNSDCIMLEKIQRRFARFLFHKGLLPAVDLSEFHYHPVLESLNLQSLQCRRDRFDATLLLQVLYHIIDGISLDKYQRTRDSNRAMRSHRTFTTLIGCPSSMNRCIQLLNSLAFDWTVTENLPFPRALRLTLERIPLYK